MAFTLDYLNLVLLHAVDKAIRIIDPSAPVSRKIITQRFRLSKTVIRRPNYIL